MSSAAPFPVNIFLRGRDLQLHGLVNLLPALGALALAVPLYAWLGILAAAAAVAVALALFIWFTIVTYWYANTALTDSSTGLPVT